MGKLWKKRAKKQKLRIERDRRKVLEDIKDIFLDALSIEVNEKFLTIGNLCKIINKFNKDIDGQEKILKKI